MDLCNRVIHFDLWHELQWVSQPISVLNCNAHPHVFSTWASCLQQVRLTQPGRRHNTAWLLYFSSLSWLVTMPGEHCRYYRHCKLDLRYPDWHSDVIFFPFPKPCCVWKSVKSGSKLVVDHTDSSAMTGSPNITMVV